MYDRPDARAVKQMHWASGHIPQRLDSKAELSEDCNTNRGGVISHQDFWPTSSRVHRFINVSGLHNLETFSNRAAAQIQCFPMLDVLGYILFLERLSSASQIKPNCKPATSQPDVASKRVAMLACCVVGQTFQSFCGLDIITSVVSTTQLYSEIA